MKLNYNFDQRKPEEPIPEFMRKVDVVDGREIVSYVPVVYPKFPSVDAFSIESMIAAGISPESINISTQNVDRLDGIDSLAAFDAEAVKILEEQTPKSD